MWCPNCGTKLDDGAKFCPNCGTKVQNDIIKPVSENRMEPESEWDGQVEDENDYSRYADLDLEDDEKKVSKMPLIISSRDRKSTRLNSSHTALSRMPSSA